MASAGDLNADGYADVVVGADYFADGEGDEGAAFVYFGSEAGPSEDPDWSHTSGQQGAQYGIDVSSAGTVR